MNHKLRKYALGLMIGMGLAGVSMQATAGGITTYADIGAQSQYIWRGAAQSVNNDIAIQGDVGVEHESGLSANVWFSTGVDVGTGKETEFDITVDYSGEAGDLGYSVGYIAYKYTDTALEFNEMYGGVSYDIASLTAYYDSDNKNLYTELGLGTTVADMFDVSLAAGVNSPDVGSSTNHYTLSASKAFDNVSVNATVGKAGSVDAEFAVGVNAGF
ncbi:MAG: TorF family putative porin [Ghiorsea sp.]